MDFTNEKIYETAYRQSAVDAGCEPECFQRSENVVVLSRNDPRARKYLTLPFACNLISYGSNVVASVSKGCREAVTDYISRYTAAHCFETPNLHVLDDLLRPKGYQTCFMSEYFLPDLHSLREQPCVLPVRLLHPADFAPLYAVGAWGNALCEKRRELDILGVGAYDGGRLVGLAACSADCETMWQIGVDVLPDWRRQGLAAALATRLALHILERGKVPFYCAAWSNLGSVRNAVKSGFRPAWVELTAKTWEFTAEINRV